MRLTEAPLAVRSTEWSPDGTQILITANSANEDSHMYVVPSQGGVPMRLFANDGSAETDPRWSPDGTRVVYSTTRDPWKTLDKAEIRMLEIASGKITSMAGSGEDFSPRWSPDARYIAALTISEHKLRVYDLGSRQWTTAFNGFANFPCWSKDGRFMNFGDWEALIGRVSVNGGPTQFIASMKDIREAGTFGGWFGLDPDDVPLFLRDNGIDEVHALTFTEK
jgi:Tol biopolymer transport system component